MAVINQKKLSSTQFRLYVDLVLLISFVLVNIPQATGIGIHEWASVLFIMPMLVHILLDWKWVVYAYPHCQDHETPELR